MPTIKILNRDYQISCGPGEEKKLFELAERLDTRLRNNAKIFRNANENMLLVLTALTLEDAVVDSRNSSQDESLLNEIAERIEKICKSLD